MHHQSTEKPNGHSRAVANNVPHANAIRRPASPKKANETGLPAQLKAGIESISGYSMDDVRVHYNSSRPAQLKALAFAQGSHIHIAPGREKHLPHEAWHVVQQKQGRVRPTGRLENVSINDEATLEKEADTMGERALYQMALPGKTFKSAQPSTQPPVQRAVGFEFQTGWQTYFEMQQAQGGATQTTFPKETALYGGRTSPQGWTMETDGRDIEFVVEPPIEESNAGLQRLLVVMGTMTGFIQQMELLQGQPRLTPASHPQFFNPGWGGNSTVIEPNGAIAAQPQATIGIRLDRIQDLFAEMHRTGANGDFSRDQGGFYPNRAGAIAGLANNAPNLNGVAPSNSLKGLLTLVIQYLLQGVSVGSRAYAKDIAFAMARTDFASIFSRLPNAEKLYLQQDPHRWVDYALTAAGLAGTGNTVLINQRITDGGKLAQGVLLPLTRGQWLHDMARGNNAVDRFTAAATQGAPAYTDVNQGNRLRAPGLLGNTFDPVGPANGLEGVILELRQMKRNIPANDWYEVTRAVLLYAKALNNTADGGPRPQYQR